MWGKILKSVIVCAFAAFAIGGCDNDLGTDDRGDIQDLLDDLRGISHYTLTTNASPSNGGYVSRSPSKTSYTSGESVTVTASAYSGYTFTGWSGASSSSYSSVTISMTESKTLTANFQTGNNPTPVTPVVKTTFSDGRDGKTYSKVTIGGQTWMAENLNYDVPDNTTDVCHGNNSSNCATYGRLYNWATAMGIDATYNNNRWNGSDVNHRGVCPVGWHIPSDAEWTQLTNYVGGSSYAGTKLKSSTGWNSYSGVPVGTNQYGFSALPGGYGISDGSFGTAGFSGNWWSSAEDDA